jgi:hypothetical protein
MGHKNNGHRNPNKFNEGACDRRVVSLLGKKLLHLRNKALCLEFFAAEREGRLLVNLHFRVGNANRARQMGDALRGFVVQDIQAALDGNYLFTDSHGKGHLLEVDPGRFDSVMSVYTLFYDEPRDQVGDERWVRVPYRTFINAHGRPGNMSRARHGRDDVFCQAVNYIPEVTATNGTSNTDPDQLVISSAQAEEGETEMIVGVLPEVRWDAKTEKLFLRRPGILIVLLNGSSSNEDGAWKDYARSTFTVVDTVEKVERRVLESYGTILSVETRVRHTPGVASPDVNRAVGQHLRAKKATLTATLREQLAAKAKGDGSIETHNGNEEETEPSHLGAPDHEDNATAN